MLTRTRSLRPGSVYPTTPNTGARHQVRRTRDSELSITYLERQTVRRNDDSEHDTIRGSTIQDHS